VSELTGTGAVVALVVARDRLRFLAWLAGIVVLVWATAASTKGLYPTQADLAEAAAVAVDNPAALAFNGPAQALDTLGGQIAFQVGAFGLLLVGLMNILLVGRVTRAEEDSGRLELVRSMPVGRHAPLAAGLLVVAVLDVVLGVAVALTLIAQDLSVHGSLVFGASYLVLGLAFLGITAVTAQVAENPRVASGSAGAVLGVAYALRAAGDIGDGTLSWLSPIGLAQKARPYAGEQWWPLGLLLALGLGLVWVAVTLTERRDFGAGMVAPKAGPAVAAPSLSSPLGLALRLNRGAVFWWGVSVLALGLVYGSLADSIEDFIADNEAMADILAAYGGASLVDSFLATSLLVIALLAAGPALQIAVRAHSEETALRTEAVLATPISRSGWLISHAVVAVGAGAVALALGGFGLGFGYAVTGGGGGEIPRVTAAALAYLPALALLVAVTVALYGLAPRWTAGGWVVLGWCFVIAMFGELLDLPGWVFDTSPFQHIPAVPAAELALLPLAVLTAAVAGLTALGFAAFRSRDLLSA
jgi:ABC-2 type transport system permease protein